MVAVLKHVGLHIAREGSSKESQANLRPKVTDKGTVREISSSTKSISLELSDIAFRPKFARWRNLE